MSGHSEVGASGAYRWMNCPGSVSLSRGVKRLESEFASEGHAAHEYAALVLEHLFKGGPYPAMAYEGPKLDEEAREAVDIYTDYCFKLEKESDGVTKIGIEEKVRLDQCHPGMFGTIDFFLYDEKSSQLTIVDYKHGVGDFVGARGNSQLRYYTAGLIFGGIGNWSEELKIKNVIIQPRCFSGRAIKEDEYTAWELKNFVRELKNAVEAAYEPNAKLKAGEWCKYCPASPRCPVLQAIATSVASGQATDFTKNTPAPIRTIGHMLDILPMLRKWIKNVSDTANQMAKDGETPEGYKIVPTRGERKWTKSKEEILQVLTKMGIDAQEGVELKSPAQIEKLKLTEGQLATLSKHWVSVSKGVTVAPNLDPREGIKTVSAEDRFAGINLEEN